MTAKNRISIDDLYFGVRVWDLNHDKLMTINLFDVCRVKRSVALWVLKSEEEKKNENERAQMLYLFGDVWARFQYEFVVCPLMGDGEKAWKEGVKVDTFSLYVEPNFHLLLDLVSRVTKASAKRYLKNNKY